MPLKLEKRDVTWKQEIAGSNPVFPTKQELGAMTNVCIYRPVKSPMQSGRANLGTWVVEFETGGPRRIDPLMGWVGSGDTRGQVRLKFPTLEEAKDYARKRSLAYRVQEPKERRIKPKEYAANFPFDRVL